MTLQWFLSEVWSDAAVASYSFFVGYSIQSLYPCYRTAAVTDDRVDNDCDGVTDEEEWNYGDDDGDGEIDEDTYGQLITTVIPPTTEEPTTTVDPTTTVELTTTVEHTTAIQFTTVGSDNSNTTLDSLNGTGNDSDSDFNGTASMTSTEAGSTRRPLVTPWMFFHGEPFIGEWYKQPFFISMFVLLGLPPVLALLYHAMKVSRAFVN